MAIVQTTSSGSSSAASFLTGSLPINPRDETNCKTLFAFGDSFSDSGAGYVDSDGPPAIACAATILQISFNPATDLGTTDAGLNFAVSGAQTGEDEGQRTKDALLGRGMQNQVQAFVERVRSGKVSFDPSRTLFFIAGGLNDGERTTADTITNLENIVRRIYQTGGRQFLIATLPTKIPAYRAVGLRLNPAIAQLAATLPLTLPDARLNLSRWGEYFDEVMIHPARYGIINTTDACAGRALFDENPAPRGRADSYYYYHEEHPSAAVHRVVALGLYREIVAAIPRS